MTSTVATRPSNEILERGTVEAVPPTFVVTANYHRRRVIGGIVAGLAVAGGIGAGSVFIGHELWKSNSHPKPIAKDHTAIKKAPVRSEEFTTVVDNVRYQCPEIATPYEVKAGDSLWNIVSDQDKASDAKFSPVQVLIFEKDNPQLPNPNQIVPKQTLHILQFSGCRVIG